MYKKVNINQLNEKATWEAQGQFLTIGVRHKSYQVGGNLGYWAVMI